MLDKYPTEFEEIYREYEEIKEKKGLLKIIGKHLKVFKDEEIGPLAISCYFIKYAQQREIILKSKEDLSS